MTIVRVSSPRRFLVVPQRTAAAPLSLEALGLLVRLLAHGDGWEVRPGPLAREAGVGRDKLRRILSELEAAGFLRRHRRRDERGRWRWESVIYAEQQKILCGDKSDTIDGFSGDGKSGDGSPVDGFSGHTYNTDPPNTNSHNTDTHTTHPPVEKSVCVEFAKKIREGRVRSETGLLAALCRASDNPILVTDEIAREAAARGGYSGPWPPLPPNRAADIAQRAIRKRAEIMSRAEMAKRARRGETWDELEHRLSRERKLSQHLADSDPKQIEIPE